MVQYEFDARKTLAAKGCDSAPLLYRYKQTKQDASGLVPDGWIIYKLVPQMPGENLGFVDEGRSTRFWSSPAPVREEIRKAFRTAWE